MRKEYARIDEHADGDKKQRDEGITKGQQPGQGAERDFGLADNEAGQKCSQGERESDGLSDGGSGKPESKRNQERQFLISIASHPLHEGRNPLGGDKHDWRQDQDGLSGSESQREQL